MINPEDIKAGVTLGHADAALIRDALFKLAELEKQQPVGSFHIYEGSVEATTDYLADGDWTVRNGEVKVYARPAPAINLAEMAELYKQEPRKVFQCSACGCEGLDEPPESECHCLGDGAHWIESELFTRPALAINLAEIVPEKWTLKEALKFVEGYTPPSEEEAVLFAVNSFRTSILRNIEEQSQ